MQELTLADRQKAKRVIEDLRRDHSVAKISDLLEIRRQYLAYAVGLYKHRRNGGEKNSYLCPKWVIVKILGYGHMLGSRRSPSSLPEAQLR